MCQGKWKPGRDRNKLNCLAANPQGAWVWRQTTENHFHLWSFSDPSLVRMFHCNWNDRRVRSLKQSGHPYIMQCCFRSPWILEESRAYSQPMHVPAWWPCGLRFNSRHDRQTDRQAGSHNTHVIATPWCTITSIISESKITNSLTNTIYCFSSQQHGS